MFNVGPAELLVILVVALLVLGPKKLPEAARQMGKAMTEFRRVTAGLQDEVRGVLDDHLAEPAPVDPGVLPVTPPEHAPTVQLPPEDGGTGAPPPPSPPPASPAPPTSPA